MPPRSEPSGKRPSTRPGGSNSAALAFAAEPAETPQRDQSGSSRNETNSDPESVTCSVMPASTNNSDTTSGPANDDKNGEVVPAAAEVATDEIDQLENEVIHFMTLSLEEKEKSEVLSGRLAIVTQEKEDLERQVDELDQGLSRTGCQYQHDGVSAAAPADAISRVNANIAKLRMTTEQRHNDLTSLASDNDQYIQTIANLEARLKATRDHFSQRTWEEQSLREELAQTTRALRSEEHTNEELLGDMKTIEQECDELRIEGAWTGKKLAEMEQDADTLRGLVKSKTSELQESKQFARSEAETLQKVIDCKQKEIESLTTAAKTLTAKLESFESAHKEQLSKKLRLQFSSKAGRIESAAFERDGMAAQSDKEHNQPKDEVIKKLTEELQRNQKRRIRAIAIGIDLSASADDKLVDGIKRLYTHFLEELKRSPCQTYVMTIVHGPDIAASVKSQFSDTWATHEEVLKDQQPSGYQQHVACLRKIKECTMSSGILDLQVILLGDGDTDGDSPGGSRAVCADYCASNPTVHIHSVVVKTGTEEETEKYWKSLEGWHTWNYASGTGGNMMVWWTNNPLPDLSSLVF
ncbi:hypothetical protein Daus18300_011176 [Diaporthe australafricana]|uniref:Uncharacterized protein n=1 Tax=Diaporthe australafricana TaxID=127596 RepID=A0ABR3W7M2_9PEZI